ncbi:MAG: hypothetical protein J7L22_04725, partial [Candidatus Marinimicrobia bacterium]|nr:hypothetical protein [Candidatus Neomarinimicrobiota bacterium]
MKKLIFMISILTAIFAASLFAQEDVTPPTLTGFSFTPDAVDVTSGPATVTFTVNATDDISGLSSVTIYLESPSYLYCSSCSGNFESGILEGTYTGTLTIRQYSEAGEWKVNYILLNDIVGNHYVYYTSELETMGFPTTLNVTSVEDVTPPTLTGFSFTPDAVDVTSGPATVTCTVNATDDISGLSSVTIYLESPSYLYCSSCSGNFESGILEGTYTGTLT